MANQTDKDFRLLVTELALKKLETMIFSKSTVRPGMGRDETNRILSNISSELMKLKYSYMAPEDMARSEMVDAIYSNARALYEGYAEAVQRGMGDMPRATLMWSFNVLSGLKRRLGNQGTLPSHGIDMVAVKIRNMTKSGQLFTTRCSAGQREFTIMTNITGLSVGDTLAAALLPPAMVGGVASEAMFLGKDRVEAKAGALLDPDKLNSKEADGILYNELKGL